MKFVAAYALLAVVLPAGHELAVALDGMNTWLEFAIKLGAALTAMGGAWKWLIGPGYRGARKGVHWTRSRLETIERVDTRLGRIEGRLNDGEDHFQRIDSQLEVMTSDEARAVRRALRDNEPVRMTEGGNVDRRGL